MGEFSRKLLLVEDDPLVASLLTEVLEHADFSVKLASSAAEATKIAAKFDPDVAVLDINLGHGPSGVVLSYVLDQKYPGIAILFLTKHPDLRTAGYREDEVPAGCGFLRKDLIQTSDAVIAAIEEVIAHRAKLRQDGDPRRPLGELTKSQVALLRLVAQGYTNSAIARERKTSIRAVEMALKGVYQNLGIAVDGDLNPRVEAARMFISIAGTPDRGEQHV
jgi:DNA-binding NarL/FixJ family response regulator